jgi:Fibronectin type III domain
VSLPAAEGRRTRARAPRRRAVVALAAALCATGSLAAAGSADTSSPVFGDPRGDSGAATDLLSNVMTHVENNPGSAADDQLLLTSVLSKADQGARFTSDDFVFWYLNTDNNPATGGPGAAPGFSAIGAEFRIVLFGPAAPQTVPDVELQAWNGSGFAFVRDLVASEAVIYESRGIVGLQIPLAEVGVTRGSTLALVQFAGVRSGSDSDYAPDHPPRYTLTIPAAPAPPAVVPSAATVAAGETSLTVGATVDPRGLPTAFRFQYGTTPAYGSETSTGDAGAGSSPVPVTATVTGLTPGTTYNFRVIATNAAGTTVGPNQVATTSGPVPTAQTTDAIMTAARSALLSGVVGTRGVTGSVHFAWGRSATALSSRTRARRVTGDRVTVRAALRKLTPNRRYHYRLVVESPGGRAEGAVKTFVARQTRLVATVKPRRAGATAGRTALRDLDVVVRAVSATTGRSVVARKALRSARVRVSCLRGCRLNEVVPLERRSVRADHLAGARGGFWGTRSRARSGPVKLVVRRSARRAALDLAPLFSDGRGHPYLFPKGATILIRVGGPGVVPSAARVTVGTTIRTKRCALVGGRAVGCRIQ